MPFVKKTWKDRLSEFPKRWKLKTLSSTGDTQSVEMELDDGTVITQGDRFNAATMNDLEQRIEDAFSSSVAGVSSFNGRVGAVTSENSDYSSNMISHTNSDSTESDVETEINSMKATKVDDTQLRSAGSTGTDFYFDYKDGKYGWNSSSARGANTFHPFKQPVVDTKTITAKTTTDLGDDHTYRYIDTTGVVNTNSGTYTFPSGDTGGTKDLGEANSYRYVNAGNVYAKGKADSVKTFRIRSSCDVSAGGVPYIAGARGNATLDATITVRGTTVTVDSFSLSSYCWAQNDEAGETTSNTNTVYTCTIT